MAAIWLSYISPLFAIILVKLPPRQRRELQKFLKVRSLEMRVAAISLLFLTVRAPMGWLPSGTELKRADEDTGFPGHPKIWEPTVNSLFSGRMKL